MSTATKTTRTDEGLMSDDRVVVGMTVLAVVALVGAGTVGGIASGDAGAAIWYYAGGNDLSEPASTITGAAAAGGGGATGALAAGYAGARIGGTAGTILGGPVGTVVGTTAGAA